MNEVFKEIRKVEDITEDVVSIIEAVYDGYYADEPRIDWFAFLDRAERLGMYDFGSDMDSAVIKQVKKIVKGLKQ